MKKYPVVNKTHRHAYIILLHLAAIGYSLYILIPVQSEF